MDSSLSSAENKRGVNFFYMSYKSSCHQGETVSDTGSEGLGTLRRVSGVQEKGAGQIYGPLERTEPGQR